MASIIPEDIINTHILPRLPSKSIGQFRCVSKGWLSLLTDPKFIQTHQKTLNTNCFIFQESNVNKSLVILESSKDGPLCSVPYNSNNHELNHLYIIGSVNGLVLASCSKRLPFEHFTYLVLNLTTKDYVDLPSLITYYNGMKGFGYDSVSGDYKVVIFSQNYDRRVYLYNLRTNTTKLVMSHSPYQDYHFNMLSSVFVSGFLHWIFNNSSKQDEDELVIVAFSLADEKLSELPPPSQVDLSDMDTRLVSLGDKLALYHQVKGEIWVMNEYGVHKSWTKILVSGFHKVEFYKPMVFYDNGKLLFLTNYRLAIYDIEEQTFSKTVDISYIKFKSFIGAYAESLVSPPKFSASE